MQFTPQLAPLILLSAYRLTAVLTQFQQFQSCQHTVCYRCCCQADCCHRLLILLCIYTIVRHIMNILTVNMYWQTAAWYSMFCLIITGPVCTAIAQ